MGITLQNQALIFLFAVAAGAVIALVYDIFRVIRIAIPHNTFTTAFEDVLFSLLADGIIIIYIMAFNNGTFRLYIGFGMVLGFVLWHYTLGALIVLQARFIDKILKIILRFLLYPFKLILKLICKLFGKLFVFLKKPFIFLKKNIIILVDNILRKIKKAGGKKLHGKNKKNKHNAKNNSRRSTSVPPLHFSRSAAKNKRKKRTAKQA